MCLQGRGRVNHSSLCDAEAKRRARIVLVAGDGQEGVGEARQNPGSTETEPSGISFDAVTENCGGQDDDHTDAAYELHGHKGLNDVGV